MGTNRGFTLIELMVTVAIIAIIGMLAAPSFGNLVAQQQLSGSISEIKLSISQAKSQAAAIKAPVALCLNKTSSVATIDANACATAAPINGYAAMTPADKLEVQRSRVILVKIDPKVAVDSTSATSIIVNEVGSTNSAATFSLCKAAKRKTVTVTRLGIITETVGTC